MKFLVTGGAGFVGSNIAQKLVKEGHTVVVVDNLNTGFERNLVSGIEFHRRSILDLDFLKSIMTDVDYVFHEAAIPSVARSVDDPISSFEANVTGTLNVLIAARDCSVKRVVYAGSSSAYGNTEILPKVETMPPNPLSPYALSKFTGEELCKQFYELYGLETVVLRYFNVFGPRQDPNSHYSAVIPLFIKAIKEGREPIVFGDGLQSRDFTFIDNVVDGNIKACFAKDAPGKVFNIACNDRITLLDLISKINKYFGKNIKPIFKDERLGDVKHSQADISLAKDVLGYSPVVSFDEGLKKTIEWYSNEVVEDDVKVCIVGLGYVGLPLAVEFAKHYSVSGFDVNEKKIDYLKNGIDPIDGTLTNELKKVEIEFSANPSVITDSNFIIVSVPTPIHEDKTPDISYMVKVSELVGKNLSKDSIVVFESTVYPGLTEEICIPILEKESSLKCGVDFNVGYSPERVNPGDSKHTIDKIVKVVSGHEKIASVYGKVIKAGVHVAPNIKTAEAAKVIENIQRDLNIGLMNELSIIFEKMDIDTKDVIEAAGTKWNFHKYTPGMVGGHCIPVDPYYLTSKAEELGHIPKIILAGREVNEFMPKYIALLVRNFLSSVGKSLSGSKVLVLGLTFKENLNDVRHSRVSILINTLKKNGVDLYCYDPLVDNKIALDEFGVPNTKFDDIGKLDAVVLATGHNNFSEITLEMLKSKMDKPILVDVKGFYDKEKALKMGFNYKRL